MHWSHAVSEDLIHWKHMPIALAPTHDYDRDGCFSGCGIVKDDRLYLFYTGNIPNEQNQCMAYSDDGVNFVKYEHNPIIRVTEDEDVFKPDFRGSTATLTTWLSAPARRINFTGRFCFTNPKICLNGISKA